MLHCNGWERADMFLILVQYEQVYYRTRTNIQRCSAFRSLFNSRRAQAPGTRISNIIYIESHISRHKNLEFEEMLYQWDSIGE